MSNVLITGGFGALGYALLRKLRSSEDKKSDIIIHLISCLHEEYTDRFEFDVDIKTLNYDEAYSSSFYRQEIDKADIIVHLAEHNIRCNRSFIYNTNVNFTSLLLEEAAAKGKRVVVPCWQEFDYSSKVPFDMWTSSMVWRAEIAGMFSTGNAVINTVLLPRIINPLSDSRTWGNLVKRFYTYSESIPVTVSTEELNDSAKWIWVDDAAQVIIDEMKKRTRKRCIAPWIKASTESIAQYVAWKTGVDYIDVAEAKDKETRRTYPKSPQEVNLPAEIITYINKCIEVWDAQKE